MSSVSVKKMSWALSLLSISMLADAQTAPTLLRERLPANRPTLMVLGTAHFANPGRDIVNNAVENVLSPVRQKEIAAVVEQLAAFRPTHIAVEWPRRSQSALDKRVDVASVLQAK